MGPTAGPGHRFVLTAKIETQELISPQKVLGGMVAGQRERREPGIRAFRPFLRRTFGHQVDGSVRLG